MDIRELLFRVDDHAYAPALKPGDIIKADPHGTPTVGGDLLAVYGDGHVIYGRVLARCGDGAYNLRAPSGDCFRVKSDRVILAPVLGITSMAELVDEGFRDGVAPPQA